jgi:hypothetical protein
MDYIIRLNQIIHDRNRDVPVKINQFTLYHVVIKRGISYEMIGFGQLVKNFKLQK